MVTIHPDPRFSLECALSGRAHAETLEIPYLFQLEPNEIYDFPSREKGRVKANAQFVLPFLFIKYMANWKVTLIVCSTLLNSVVIYCMSALGLTLCLLSMWLSKEG